MTKLRTSWSEVSGFGAKALWILSRLHVYSVIIGAVVTVATLLFSGFWTFRVQHQVTVVAQYNELMKADESFEKNRRGFEVVFDGKVPSPGKEYKQIALEYIQQLQATSNALPSTKVALGDYIEAISTLQKFYAEPNPPTENALDRSIFFGGYRLALDRYLTTRETYLAQVASESGSYWRYLLNS